MTAYEMRISDWSSDVCSSDLRRWTGAADEKAQRPRRRLRHDGRRVRSEKYPLGGQCDGPDRGVAVDAEGNMNRPVRAPFAIFARAIERVDDPDPLMGQALRGVDALFGQDAVVGTLGPEGVENIVIGYLVAGDRSEEHTSELQSLMRISYAVFC